jgi:ribonuclease G
MIDEILINIGLTETRVALVEGGRLVELGVYRDGHDTMVGDVYLGRVDKVVPGMQAAFVDLGLNRAGFLAAADAAVLGADPLVTPSIEQVVRDGDSVLVQVSKDPIGDKGPKVTADVTFAGRALVYTPLSPTLAVSRRIADLNERERLLALAGGLREDTDGFILRTVAAGAEADVLVAEAAGLRQLWRELESRIAEARTKGKRPCRLHRDLEPVIRALRDHGGLGVGSIRIDDGEALTQARTYIGRCSPLLAGRLAWHRGPGPLFARHNIEAQIEAALRPRVRLPSGGEITIQATEGLTAIDVDSGSYVSGRDQGETCRVINLEAAAEIARQLRLRAIGGLIVIDFIHMNDPATIADVQAAFAQALADDPAPIRVAGMSELGLVEMTRRRVREPLAHLLTECCPTCDGDGRVPTFATALAELLRAIEREAAWVVGPLMVRAAPELTNALDPDRRRLLERRVGRAVEWRAEADWPRGRWDVTVAS